MGWQRATHWQIQLTVAMGNAADNEHLLLQPYRLAELMPLLARLYQAGVERGLLMVVGNNIGYFGPYEHVWRGFGDERVHWTGCSAGHTVLALEADGTVKGCPSLATNGFGGGNVRDLSLEQIWATSPRFILAACAVWPICGDSAATAITPTCAVAAAPGHRTRCWAALATIRIVITACFSCSNKGCANAS
jgi:MoaA/NifB/PqqE/SkfB family radical SAM enzyme